MYPMRGLLAVKLGLLYDSEQGPVDGFSLSGSLNASPLAELAPVARAVPDPL